MIIFLHEGLWRKQIFLKNNKKTLKFSNNQIQVATIVSNKCFQGALIPIFKIVPP